MALFKADFDVILTVGVAKGVAIQDVQETGTYPDVISEDINNNGESDWLDYVLKDRNIEPGFYQITGKVKISEVGADYFDVDVKSLSFWDFYEINKVRGKSL